MKSARSFLSVNTVFFYFWYKVSSVFGLFQETGCFSIRVFATAFGYQDKPKYHPHNMSQRHKKNGSFYVKDPLVYLLNVFVKSILLFL